MFRFSRQNASDWPYLQTSRGSIDLMIISITTPHDQNRPLKARSDVINRTTNRGFPAERMGERM